MTALQKLAQTTAQGIHEMLPTAFSTAFQAASQDARMMKIVVGISLICAGTLLVTKSGVPCLSQKKKTRLLTSLIGFTSLVGGVSLIYSAFQEMMASNRHSQLAQLAFPEVKEQKGSGIVCDESSCREVVNCQDQIKPLESQFLQCPEAQQLMNEVLKGGPITFDCYPASQFNFANYVPEAYANQESRQILFLENRGSLLHLGMELFNMKSEKLYKCEFPSADAFARRAERNEYRNLVELAKIIDRCVERGIWPNELSQFSEGVASFKSFKEYLKYQEEMGHTANFRLQWQMGGCSKKS